MDPAYAPSPWMILPLGALLASIALVPLLCGAWWTRHYPKMAIGLGAVTLAPEDYGDFAKSIAADTGRGIAPEVIERLFEPFATFGKAKGTGLGSPTAVHQHRAVLCQTPHRCTLRWNWLPHPPRVARK